LFKAAPTAPHSKERVRPRSRLTWRTLLECGAHGAAFSMPIRAAHLLNRAASDRSSSFKAAPTAPHSKERVRPRSRLTWRTLLECGAHGAAFFKRLANRSRLRSRATRRTLLECGAHGAAFSMPIRSAHLFNPAASDRRRCSKRRLRRRTPKSEFVRVPARLGEHFGVRRPRRRFL
jgi:hypothetical protein